MGEAFVPGEIARTTLETLLVDTVVGMDSFDVKSLVERSYTDPYHFGGSAFVQSVISGVDIAC